MNDIKTVRISTAKELFDTVSLDYKNLIVDYSENINFINYFDLKPEDYLYFAKSDLMKKDKRGLINALSNAKRAIDCLIENILKNFNINIKKLPKVALDFCEEVLDDESKNIKPLSFRLFCALGLSPIILVKEVRSLRNKVEHEFNNPQKEDVLRACEVAELLINNLKAKEVYSCGIEISDIHRTRHTSQGGIKSIRFDYTFVGDINNGRFNIYFYDSNKGICQYFLNPEDKIYYYFLKAMFIAEFDTEELELCIKRIVREINPNLDLDEINIRI
ncbi:hypothetical protein [Acinetobacter nosocomialis]|uniref:hypothetical protein n=1 Tax=Acinetobacter nosocomialis TaxID=106654 RepID=UPI001BAAC6CA|nr:hypothetical protein [Acinetobacter nosocomialis]